MANDFKVLFGLEPDASDKLIRKQLGEIAEKISEDGLLKVAVNIDPSIQSTLENQLQSMLDKMNLNVQVGGNIGSIPGSPSANKGINNQIQSYKKLQSMLSQIFTMSSNINKIQQSGGVVDSNLVDQIRALSANTYGLKVGFEEGTVKDFTKKARDLDEVFVKLKGDFAEFNYAQSSTKFNEQEVNKQTQAYKKLQSTMSQIYKMSESVASGKISVDDKFKNEIGDLNRDLYSLGANAGNIQDLAGELSKLEKKISDIKRSYSEFGSAQSSTKFNAQEVNKQTQAYKKLQSTMSQIYKMSESVASGKISVDDKFKNEIGDLNRDLYSLGANAGNIQDLAGELSKLEKKISDIKRSYSEFGSAQSSTKFNAQEVNKQTQAYKKLQSTMSQIYKMSESVASGKISVDDKFKNEIGDLNRDLYSLGANAGNIQDLAGELSKLEKKISDIKRSYSEFGSAQSSTKFNAQEVNKQTQAYKKLNRILTDTYRMSKDADVGKFKGFIDASTLDDIEILKTSAEALDKKYASGNVQGFTGEVEKLGGSLDKLKASWHKVTKDKQSDTWAYQQSINFKNLESQAQDYFTKFGSNIRKSPELLNQYTEFFNKINEGAFKTDKEASEYYKSMIKGFRAAGVEVETFSGKLKELFNKHIKTTLAMAAIGMLSQGLRLMYQNVLDIDLAMTELKKVTDLTDGQYSNFLDNANTRAIKLGATIKDVVNATSEFVKLGFTVDDASAIADAALIYKNVGDGIHSINDASQAIISTLKSFKISASEALEIVDRYNEVSNKFSVTSADIGAILSRSASALSAAGNDINQAIGLGVAGNVVVQNAEKVGTVLSTLSMRIRGASESLADAGLDIDGMAKSTSDLRQRIIELTDVNRDGSGFDMMIDDSTFKSTYEILKGISEVYGSMKDIERAELLELLAGKRNANVTESILRNFDDAEAAMKVSMDSYGSALAENEKRLDSIRGRTQQLQAAFESLSTTVINSELVKGGIGFLRTAVQLVDAFATTFGTLPTLIGAVTAGLSLSGQNAGETEKVNMPTLPERSKFDLQWRGVSILDRRRHPNCWNGVRAA